MDLDISIDTNQTLKYLGVITERLSDMRPAWEGLDPIIRDIVQKNFDAGGRPKWKPRKGEKEYGGILKKSGKLKAAATNPTLRLDAIKAVWTAHVGDAGVAHHYGVRKDAQVHEHTRKILSAFGRSLAQSKSFKVKSHTMRMNLPERPYFCIPLGYGEPERIRSSVIDFVFGGLWYSAKSGYTRG